MVLVVSSGPINDVFIEILLFGALPLVVGPAINVQITAAACMWHGGLDDELWSLLHDCHNMID